MAVLSEIIDARATHLLVAEDPPTDEVLGSLTLCVFRIPTGQRAWIEDVVVDDGARGRGVGEALSLFAIDLAADLGCRTVDLTSRPEPRGRQPPLPAHRLRGPRHQRVQVPSATPSPVGRVDVVPRDRASADYARPPTQRAMAPRRTGPSPQ